MKFTLTSFVSKSLQNGPEGKGGCFQKGAKHANGQKGPLKVTLVSAPD